MGSKDGGANWTETVEDLLDGGDIDGAISLLETLVSNLESPASPNSSASSMKLSSALLDLSKLYSSKGLSLKADELRSRSIAANQRSFQHRPQESGSDTPKESASDGFPDKEVSRNNDLACDRISNDGPQGGSSDPQGDASAGDGSPDDDWEAVADRAADELLSPQVLPALSNVSLEDPQIEVSKRRGRGTFSYKRPGLYSDQEGLDGPIKDVEDDKAVSGTSEGETKLRNLNHGTRHVLVLADFPPSTRTTDLEKLLEKFKDRVVIRWVNDTVALAVFRNPSVALEASNSVQCQFTIRVLEEDDELLSSIPLRDLEPPRQRPQTSARTAQRLIAQGMGIKLPSMNSDSREFRNQEEARRSRIISRQNMKNDAWGDDAS